MGSGLLPNEYDLLPMQNVDPITQIQLMSGGYYLSRCLQVVAELGVADLIDDEPVSAAQLAQSTGSHPEALSRVLNLLAHTAFSIVSTGDFSIANCQGSSEAITLHRCVPSQGCLGYHSSGRQ
jgi:hypothetical protein